MMKNTEDYARRKYAELITDGGVGQTTILKFFE